MKKVYFIVFCIILLGGYLLFNTYNNNLINSFDGNEKLISVKTNLSVNATTNNVVSFILYTNNPKSILNDYNNVNCSLYNKENLISAVILSTVNVNQTIYNKERFYIYKLYIEPASLDCNFYLEKCSLKTSDFDIEIGNLVITNYENEESNIDYKNVYVLKSDNSMYTTVNGIVLELENTSDEKVKLSSIKVSNNYVSFSNAVVLDDHIVSGSLLDDYLNYNQFNVSLGSNVIYIEPNSSVIVLLPVGYYNKCFLGNFNILINNSLFIDNCDYLESYYQLDQYKDLMVIV